MAAGNAGSTEVPCPQCNRWQKRKLETGVGNCLGVGNQENERGERRVIHQFEATLKKHAEKYEQGHQPCPKDGRALLRDSDICEQGYENQKRAETAGQTKPTN